MILTAPSKLHMHSCTTLYNINVVKQATDDLSNDKSQRIVATHVRCGRIFGVTLLQFYDMSAGKISSKLVNIRQNYEDGLFCI